MRQQLHESRPLAEAIETPADSGGRMLIQVITPGWGSSGYYSPAVVEAAASLVTVGTQMYLDHPSESDNHDRPERSVRDIAAVVTETGRWDEALQAVVAEARVVGPYRDLIEDLAPHIGLSIRGSATDVTEGEAEGRRGRIIEGLAHIDSVDFVTRAGRGGRVLGLLESQRPEVIDRAVARGVAEATADERRQQLSDAVRTTYGSDERYAWVRDFDDDTVWFEAYADDEASQTWQQGYSVSDDDTTVTLTGSRTEVRATTRYVPVTRPGSPTTEESEEDAMPNIQIEESEHTRLIETAGRVPALESERDTAIRERDEARAETAAHRRREAARGLIATNEARRNAGVTFTALEERGLLADLPTGEDGQLDDAAFTRAIDAAVAEAAERGTSSGITGFGGTRRSADAAGVSESDLDAAVGSAFGRTVKGA